LETTDERDPFKLQWLAGSWPRFLLFLQDGNLIEKRSRLFIFISVSFAAAVVLGRLLSLLCVNLLTGRRTRTAVASATALSEGHLRLEPVSQLSVLVALLYNFLNVLLRVGQSLRLHSE
jgi:hypothetical protein